MGSLEEAKGKAVSAAGAVADATETAAGAVSEMAEESRRKRTMRDRKRSSEIIGVFAKHNFYVNGFTPYELRTTLEDLGPTYVKIGQIMSSRTDMLPESYCAELERLRSSVAPLDAEVARTIIEQETGCPIGETYAEFRDEPIGSASIAQAHYGVLVDGTRVVTKVQRPGIADMMRKDFVLLKKLAGVVGVAVDADDGGSPIDLVAVIGELEKVTEEELDFRVEAAYTREFREKCVEDESVISCPTIIDELTTERILTMTYVDGYSIAKRDRVEAEGYDREAIARAITENYLHQVLDVGTFHGDPHQGNIMVAHGVPYWIDFGMIGHVDGRSVDALQEIILALMQKDSEALADAALSLGEASALVDKAAFTDDIEGLISRYASSRNLADIDVGALMEDLTDLLATHRIKMPAEYTMLIRSLVTIEGVLEEFCPELNLFEFLAAKMIERAQRDFDAGAQIVEALEGLATTGMKSARLPMLAYEAMRSLVKGRMKVGVDLTGQDDLYRKINATIANIVLALFACVLFAGSCTLCTTDIQPQANGAPVVAIIGFVMSVALAFYSVRNLARKTGR